MQAAVCRFQPADAAPDGGGSVLSERGDNRAAALPDRLEISYRADESLDDEPRLDSEQGLRLLRREAVKRELVVAQLGGAQRGQQTGHERASLGRRYQQPVVLDAHCLGVRLSRGPQVQCAEVERSA